MIIRVKKCILFEASNYQNGRSLYIVFLLSHSMQACFFCLAGIILEILSRNVLHLLPTSMPLINKKIRDLKGKTFLYFTSLQNSCLSCLKYNEFTSREHFYFANNSLTFGC